MRTPWDENRHRSVDIGRTKVRPTETATETQEIIMNRRIDRASIASSLKITPGLLLGFLVLLTAVVSSATASPLPGRVDIEDLEQTRHWQIKIDGQIREDVDIFYSDYEVAWLVQSDELGPLLISPRGRSVQRIHRGAIQSKSSARSRVQGNPDRRAVATYEESRGTMSFELDGRRVVLEPAPPLIGRQDFESVEQRHPIFTERAVNYGQRAGLKSAPVQHRENSVKVRVYFGSWSPICERIVPKIIAVEKAWGQVDFEYYGLPERLTDDEQAKAERISGVPTVLILRDGQEVDRLTGRILDDPGPALEQVLGTL